MVDNFAMPDISKLPQFRNLRHLYPENQELTRVVTEAVEAVEAYESHTVQSPVEQKDNVEDLEQRVQYLTARDISLRLAFTGKSAQRTHPLPQHLPKD